MKYPMYDKTEKPLFEYMVRFNDCLDYYLFVDFDDALKQAQALSGTTKVVLIYEYYFNVKTREFHGQNTFTIYDGIVVYDKHARVDLHLAFYVNAGDWLNPNEEWLSILKTKENQGVFL